MADKESKTEDASPKRLRDAKKKGQVAKSADLNSAISFFVFTLLIGVLGTYVFQNTYIYLKNALNVNRYRDIFFSNKIFVDSIGQYTILLFPFAAIAVFMGIVVNLLQTGFLFTTHPLKPDFKKLNPIEGFKNIFSSKSLFTLFKNLAKLSLVFFMTYKNLSSSIKLIINSGNIGTGKLFNFFLDLLKSLSFNIAIVMLGIALVDWIFQRREYKKNLKMSKQEIKDEYKEMEGSPEIKQARQRRQREIAMGRMMQDIPDSDVVITNPTHIAIALRYDKDKDMAPVVRAKGVDHVAKKIKGVAKENKIPIIENKPLARAMYKKAEIGEYVPVELYKAIAEILVMVKEIEKKNRGKI